MVRFACGSTPRNSGSAYPPHLAGVKVASLKVLPPGPLQTWPNKPTVSFFSFVLFRFQNTNKILNGKNIKIEQIQKTKQFENKEF
jgi:hypothetical protein